MDKISISEVKAGMILGKPIFSPENHKMLLNFGTVLKASTVQKLIENGIKEIEVADQYTVLITPIEQMAVQLKNTYDSIIKKYSSEKPEGNLNDDMIAYAKLVRKTADKICTDEKVLDLCVQMKILKSCYLFEGCVLTSVF